jgi:PAS domain S-box-containing protein
MPTLALISQDSNLYQELVRTLEGTAWSVEWLGPEAVDDSAIHQEVVVLDATHAEMEAWRTPRGKPVLLIMEEDRPAGLNEVVDDLVFRPARQDELVLRLERLRARTPLDDLRRQYAKTFASMAPGVVVVGPDLTMVFANPRSYEIVGHREETISSDDIGRVISIEDLPRVRDALSQRQYPRGMDIGLVRRDGTKIICSCSFAPLIGAEDHTVISFEDVTDLRETERELIKTMEFLESLIDASVDAIIATDMDQRVVLFNPSAERVSGRHVADVLGNVKLEDLLGRSSTELVMQRLLTPEHGGEGRLEPTMLDLLDLHGTRIPVQLSASLIYEHGEPSAIVLIFADLRDRIRVEERLAEAQKKLAFTEKQGVLAELAGTAAHELNQPLTSMMAYAELLLRQSEPDSTGAKTAEVLIREAERMAEIVRKIGKITRYETTAYVGQQKIFDLDRAADASSDPGAKS